MKTHRGTEQMTTQYHDPSTCPECIQGERLLSEAKRAERISAIALWVAIVSLVGNVLILIFSLQ